MPFPCALLIFVSTFSACKHAQKTSKFIDILNDNVIVIDFSDVLFYIFPAGYLTHKRLVTCNDIFIILEGFLSG